MRKYFKDHNKKRYIIDYKEGKRVWIWDIYNTEPIIIIRRHCKEVHYLYYLIFPLTFRINNFILWIYVVVSNWWYRFSKGK